MLVKKYTIKLSKTGEHHGNLLSNGSEKKKVQYYSYSFFIHLKLFQNKNLKRYNIGLALIFVRLSINSVNSKQPLLFYMLNSNKLTITGQCSHFFFSFYNYNYYGW